jgi:hypothetical protein
MANLINESEIRDTWSPIIESATGINESEKLAWMSQYCHNHKLYEDANIMSLAPTMNIQGMGATLFPTGNAGNTGGSCVAGSGDKAPSLLPLAMQVAAQTIGLDLVPVVPMAGPMGLLSYLDFVYEGGKIGANQTAPSYVKSDWDNGALGATTAAGDYIITNRGTSRIDGDTIYEVDDSAASSTSGTILAAINTAAGTTATCALVAALDDHIQGFSGVQATGSPYTRDAGESTADRVMGLSLFSKAVEAKTYQVAAAVTREQVQDLKQFGVDAVAQVEAVLTNELTQSINDLIIDNLDALAALNMTKSIGNTLDVTLGGSVGGGQTEGSEHRKVLTAILAAANLIVFEWGHF